jgi:hypothetical protein
MFNWPFHLGRLVLALASIGVLSVLSNHWIVQPAVASDITYSGFLKDYSDLTPRQATPEVLTWKAPDSRLRMYKGFIVERPYVYLRMTPNARTLAISPDELSGMADYLRNAVVNALEPEYEVVERAGKHIARVRMAIAEVVPTDGDSEVSLVTRGELSVARAVLEVEITDSVSEERLAAVVDPRVGKVPSAAGTADRWRQTKAAFRQLAKGFRGALDELHAK